MRRYIRFVLIAIDQLLNAVTGGYADETLSSRIWRHANAVPAKRRWVVACKLVDKIFFWQKGHCQKSFEMEKKHNHFPEDLK